MKAMAQIQKEFPSVVYRAGTQQGPSFDFDDKIDEGNLHYSYQTQIWLKGDNQIQSTFVGEHTTYLTLNERVNTYFVISPNEK